MLKIATSAADTITETEGVWVEYRDGAKIKVARMGNPSFTAYSEKLRAPYKKQIKRETLPLKKQQELSAKAFAKCIVMDWQGFHDLDGNELAYDSSIVEMALEHDLDFQAFVLEQSTNEALFREEEIEDTAKKSGATSNGSSGSK